MREQCKHTFADTPVGAFVNSTFGQVHAGAFVTPTFGVGMCPGAFVIRTFRAGRHSGASVWAPSASARRTPCLFLVFLVSAYGKLSHKKMFLEKKSLRK